MANLKTVQAGDPAWLRAAFELEGLKEIVGGKHEPQVVQFFADAGHSWVKDDETAWCAAFAHAMLGRGGIKGTGSLAARSYLEFGSKVTRPKRGDIVVIKRGTKAWQGHVFFWLGEDATHVWGIGGNQSNAVTVARFAKSGVLGYRRPPAAGKTPAPAPTRPPKAAAAPEKDTEQGDPLVEAIQRQLLALGYPEVGTIDGDFGTKTRGAILAFEADNGLPLTGKATKTLLTEMLSARPRAIAPERAAAPAKEVRERVPEAEATWKTKLGAMWGMAVAGVSAPLAWVVENLNDAREWARPVTDVLGDVPVWLYLGLIAGGLYWAWRVSQKGEKAAVEAYQAGERR